ncbi:lactonase family protein [Akkermansiaceae bacterium]|nr:lactonase family protein [Akkermansiaceae bacterium]MDB4445358.1 lactonase family protein [Akkermansiaceae bacterium]MDB4571727.1 lactonase family protein [Akkermansiaceae bacterium]MDB4684448.1 lactonase family protein [Akkermansiaceae bacterium]
MALFQKLIFLLVLTVPVAAETLVYFGTYTGGGSKGIYRSILDETTGELSDPVLAAELENPSFLVVSPDQKYLFAVSENGKFKGEEGGGVSSFAIGEDGGLTLISQVNSGGGAPCHISTDPQGKCLLVANYMGGSISSYQIAGDGKLVSPAAGGFIQHEGQGAQLPRQASPHAHSVNADPSGKRAYVADLGLDKVLIYKLEAAAGTIVPNDPPFLKLPDATGPRHFSFHPSGKWAYTNLEMSLQVAALSHDPETGALNVLEIEPTVPEGTGRKGNSTAECLVHPTGKWVYVSNRGHNTIAAFAIDQKTGKLDFIERESTQGKTPRNFGIDPSGKFLIAGNQGSGNVVVLKIDQDTGSLDPSGHEIEVPAAVCIRFLKR